MFSKQGSQPVKNVTEEQLLSAARNSDIQVSSRAGAIDVAYGCPQFAVWPRDDAITQYADGQTGDGLAVIHRGEITRTARECQTGPGRVTVRYGFSGRILLGPRGNPGRITLPVTVFVTDAKRERITEQKFTVSGDVSLEQPISYFSKVETLTFTIPVGSRPGEFELFVGFNAPQPANYRADQGFPPG